MRIADLIVKRLAVALACVLIMLSSAARAADAPPAGKQAEPEATKPAGEAKPAAPDPAKPAPAPTKPAPDPAKPAPAPAKAAPDPAKAAPAPAKAAPTPTKPAPDPAAEPAPKPAAEPAPKPADKAAAKPEIRFQFDGIPYNDVIRRFAEMAGKPILGEYHVEGTLTFFDPQPYTFEEAFDTFNLLLAMRGYTMVDTPRFLRVVAMKEATKAPLRIVKGWDEAEKLRPGELATMMLPLKFMSAEDAVRVLMPVVSTYGSVAPLGTGRGIIITDRLENMQRIRIILDELDTGTLSADKQVKTYKLKHASARDIATIVNGLFPASRAASEPKYIRSREGKYTRNPDYGKPVKASELGVKATSDLRTNTLFLSGAGENIALAEQIVEQLDAIEPGATGDMRVFELKNARAEDLVNTIKQLLPQQSSSSSSRYRSPGSQDVEARVVADVNTNRLIVTAPLDQLTRIEELIKTLDQASQAVGGMRIFRLKVADARELERIIEGAISRTSGDPRSRYGSSRSAMGTRVSSDARTNTLVITGSAADIQVAEQLIAELDRPIEEGEQTREIHVVQLKAGDARELASSLTRMVSQGDPRNPYDRSSTNVRIAPDAGTNSLLISAAPGDWPTIQKLLEQLEASAVPKATVSTRVIPVKHAKASELADSLNRIYGSRSQGYGSRYSRYSSGYSRPSQATVPVVISANDRTNCLIVSAGEDDQKAIAELVTTLDTPEAEKADAVRVIQVTAGDPVKIADTVRGLMPYSDRGERQTVFVRGDAASNSIFVRAPDAEFKAIEQMVKQLDKAMTDSGNIRTFRLKVADAEQLARVIQNALSKRETDRYGRTLSRSESVVNADARTNSLIVAGPAGDIQTAEKLITELDKPLSEQAREIHVVQLKVGNAREVAQALTRMLAQQSTTGRYGTVSADNIRVEAESGTNSLLISAAPGDWPTIEKILEQLKASAAPDATATTRLVPLKHANARELAETLRQVYASRRSSSGYSRYSSSQSYRPTSGPATVPVVITANERTNTLLISAAADDQKAIAELIKAMDVPAAEDAEPMRIIRLQSADAVKLADTLKAMAPRPKPGQTESVVIEAEPLSNSVLLRGPEADRKMFEEMIATLDEATQEQAREVRKIPLKHVSASQLAQMLGQLYQTSPASSSSYRSSRYGYSRSRPTTGRDERVVIAAAPGDRMLVVDGPRDKVEEIANLVASLDVADAPGQIEVRTYRLTSAKAGELAPSLARLFSEQRSRTGTPADNEPAPRFEPDVTTNQIMVSATPTQFTTIEELIKKLEVDTSLARQTRTFHLKNAKAADIVGVLQTMLVDAPEATSRYGRPAEQTPGTDVRVAAMPDTNDVVVQGPPEKIALAEELIKTFDAEGATRQSAIFIVKLKNAQAASLAEAVNAALAAGTVRSSYRSRYGPPRPSSSGREDGVTVTPELNSNSILVRGPVAKIAAVVEMIESLDAGSTGTGAEVRVYPLENGEPSVLAESLGRLFQDMIHQKAAGGRSAPTVPFSIAADDRTQSLVISTTPAHFTLVEEILLNLDKAPAVPEADVQYIWLENADATEVAAQLEDMYRTRKGEKPVISADEFSNAITIIAKDADLKVIEPIITKLDNAAKDNSYRVRVIPLMGVKAEKMAQVLSSVYQAMTGNKATVKDEAPKETTGPQGEPGPVGLKGPSTPPAPDLGAQEAGDALDDAESPGVTIAVDKHSNSLIVSGNRQELDYIQDLVDELMLSSMDLEAEFRVFKIEKADPLSVARTLDELFNPKPRTQQRSPQRGQQPAPPAPAPPPVIGVVADLRTRTVIVRAKPTDFEDVEMLIKQLDQVPTVVSEVRIFALKNTDATQVAANLKELFQRAVQRTSQPKPQPKPSSSSQQKGRPQQPQQQRVEMIRQVLELRTKQGITQVDIASMVNVSANRQTNSVIVTAPTDAMEIVAGIIEELDQSGMAAATSVRMYPVANAEVNPMVTALREVFGGATRAASKAGSRSTRTVLDAEIVISGDEAGRLIIVSAPAEEHKLIESVIKEMDQAQGTGDVTVKVYRLETADATTVATALSGTVERSPGGAARGSATGRSGGGRVQISADRSSNSIVVRAPAEEHLKIAKLLQEMDQAPEAIVKTYPIKNANVQTIVTAVKDIFTSRSGAGSRTGTSGGGGRSRVSVTGDEAGRLVVVNASAEAHELIAKVIDEIDSAQSEEEVSVKVYRLKHAAAEDVEDALQDTFQKTSSSSGSAYGGYSRYRRPQATGQVRISADESSNSLVVRANVEDHKRIAELIAQLDVAPTETFAVRMIPLKHADPQRVEDLLDLVFLESSRRRSQWGSRSSRVAPTLVIQADTDARMLVVHADDETFEKVKALAEQLDAASAGARGEPMLIPLKFAQAAGVAEAVGQAFEPPRGRRSSQSQSVTVAAEPASNSLIVTAGAENLQKVRDLVAKLDTEQTAGVRTELMLLKNARAVEVAPVLQQMVRADSPSSPRTSASSGMGRGSRTVGQPTVTVGADAGSNGLVISGPSAQVEKVKKMAADLDNATGEVGTPLVKTYPIKNAEVQVVVTALKEIFASSSGSPSASRYSRPAASGTTDASRVTITGDEAGRLVIVAAPAEKHALIAKVINEIDQAQTEDQVTVKVYRLEYANATDLATALQATVQKRTSSSSGSSYWSRWSRQSTTTGQVRINADSSSNSLIVRASAEDHKRIAELIEQLDAAPSEQYAVRLIPLANADSTTVAQVLNRVFGSGQRSSRSSRYGGYGFFGMSSSGPRSNVVIEADRDARMLMVRADDETFDKIRELATQLDTASPGSVTEPVLIPLKFAQAAGVAPAVSQAFQPPRGTGRTIDPNDVVTVVAEPVSNSIIVTASAKNLEKVKDLLEKLDSEATAGIRSEMLILENAKAEDLAPVLTKMAQASTAAAGASSPSSRYGSTARQQGVSVSAEKGSNALVISGPSNDVDKIVAMAKDLDKATTSSAATVRVIQLANGDAPEVARMVQDLYRQQYLLAIREKRSIDPLAVSSDVRANAIVLATSDDMYKQVSEWVAQIEEMQPQRGALKIITLKHADPSEVEQAIRQIFGEAAGRSVTPVRRSSSGVRTSRPGGSRGEAGAAGRKGPTGGKVETTVLPQQRAILINASDTDYEIIKQLAEALDAAAADTKRQFKVFSLKNTSNTRVALALTTLYRAVPGVIARPEDQVTVTALPDTNAVVVSAAAAKLEEVEHLIEQLDKEEIAPQLEFRIYPLENAQPTKIMPVLQQMLAQVQKTRPDEPISAEADERTRSIIVTARGPVFDQVEKIIKTLDRKPAYAEAEVLIIPLKHADATRLATVLTDMLRPSTAAQVTPEARAIQEQVRLLKVRSADGRIIPELDLTKPIKITADPTLVNTQGANVLLISSTPDNLVAMAAIVDLLDRFPLVEGTKVRVVHLKNADAESVTEILKDIFTQGQELGGKVGTSVEGKAEPDSVSGKALVNPLSVSADLRTNSLVLSGQEESLALADLIIQDLDRDTGKIVTEVRVFHLQYADVTRLAPMLEAVFTESTPTPGSEGLKTQVTRLRTVLEKKKGGQETDLPKARAALTIQADPTTSAIVVAARSDVMPLIADVIKTMDIPGAGSLNVVRIVPLVNADATRLKNVIDGLFTGPNAEFARPEDVPTVQVDTRTNALVLSASEKTFAMIGTLLKGLDAKQPIEFRDIRIVPLKNAEAITIGPVLQELMDARVQRFATLGAADAEALRIIIMADARSNSLLIGGSAEGFQLAKSLAEQLDGASPALSGQIQLFPLEHANAGTIGTTMQNLFDQRYQAARTTDVQRQRPIILPDVRVNALLVAANADDTKVIQGLLKKLDVELKDPSVQLVVIPLEHNDSGIVGPTLQRLFAARLQSMTLPGQTPVPQDRVDVEVDVLSNALIVSASKENLTLIKGLLAKVDVAPPEETGIVRMYPLENSDAQRIATMLQGLVAQGLYKPGMLAAGTNQALADREKVSVAVDIRTNTLIVSASKENFAVLEEIIRKIDSSEDFSVLGDLRMFTLKNANATRLAPTLQQLFDAKRAAEQAAGGTGRMLPVSVISDPRTNTLLVAGSRESFNAIEAMIRELDTDQVLAANEFRIFHLQQATATVLQPTIEQLFAQRATRGEPSDPVMVVTEARTNSLIVSATPEDMKLVESLVARLDAEPDRPGTTVQIFPLAKADATQVAGTLTSLYQLPGAAAGPTVGISVDERINAVVVQAGPSDIKRVGELVKELDSDTVPRVTEIRVFTLENADATELAAILNDALNQKPTALTVTSPNRQALLQFVTHSDDGGKLITSALQEGVLITPDRRSNSLVISAPLENMPLLESLINAMDSTSPRTAEIRVFTLVNSDARAMATVLNELFRMQQTTAVAGGKQAIEYTLVPDEGGENGTAAVIGSAEDVALTVTVDIRTNSLLVGGTKHYVELASEVVRELDESTAAERLTEIYRLRNAQAADIETALTNFLDQERALLEEQLGDAGAGTSQYILEREVAIVAESTTNTLLLSASPRYYDVVAQMIEELDQPPPQVLIQVLLAEVTIDDVNEFGVEWQVMEAWRNHDMVGGTAPAFAASAGLTLNPGFQVSVTGGDVNFLLRALESQGRLEMLSRPQILASDNQSATINVGQRVPFITNSRVTDDGTTINTIQYEDVGIILDVIPRINPDGFVNLEVHPEISSLDDSTVPISEGVNAIIVNSRSAETTVTVQDGHTIIIGGLITTTDRDRLNKVPILGDIPLLGGLFQSTRKVKERTELLIILTPTVLRNIEEADIETAGQVKRLNLLRGTGAEGMEDRPFKEFSDGVWREMEPRTNGETSKKPAARPSTRIQMPDRVDKGRKTP